MIEVSKFRWVHKPGAMNRVYEVMQPAIRFEKKDVIDLPPVVTLRFQTQMTPEQSKMFKDMKNDMTMEMAGGRIDAVNAADKITKLRQILCGCIKRGDAYETIPHGPRFNTLCEIIDGAKAKVIVIVPFKGIIKELERELRAKRFTVGVINGDVPPGQRKIIISNYKNEVDPHILLCHPKVMAHGLNLTEADLMVCYAPIYGNDDYSQVIERFNRAGQKNKMTIARIAAHPIEWEIYKSIDNDAQTQKTILDLYRQVVES
jgi:SNF2 family DNA or RNA helicase